MTQASEPEQALRARRAVIEEFVDGLRRLRLAAGQPAFRTMAKVSGRVSHATLHDALSGSRLPTWPTVAAFVQACGGDLGEWRRRWLDAAEVARPEPEFEGDNDPLSDAPLSDAPSPAAPGALPGPLPGWSRPAGPVELLEPARRVGPPPVGRFSGRSRATTFLAGVVVGAVVGAAIAFGITTALGAGTGRPAVCPTSDADLAAARQPMAGQEGAVVYAGVTKPSAGTPAWVDRPASDAQILTQTAVALPVTTQVTAGDALVVTLMLTSVCPGPVTVTDTLGDGYIMAADDTDTARHRTMVFVAFGVKPLTTADAIHVAYPHASKYHIAVDEFRGVSEVVGRAHAHGESGGVDFSTGADPVDCQVGDLMVAVVGTNTGSRPTMVRGWTSLPVLKLSSYILTTEYQIASVSGRCAATGATTAQWGADLVVLR